VRTAQRGVAAITAILIVAVAAAAAALMLSQQAAMLDQTMLVASRAQADEYANAGLDWARGVLRQDGISGPVDHLEEGWARPIGGMPVERAVVAGAISDEQGKFNLNNVLANGQRSEPDVKLLRQLLAGLELPPDLADAVVDWVDPGDDLTSGAGAETGYYLSLARPYRAANAPMTTVDELYRVRGFEAKVVERLRAHVTALPERAKINVNTAGETVLAAAFGGAPREKIAAILEGRAKNPFMDLNAAFLPRVHQQGLVAANEFDVKSAWFMVRVQVNQDDVQVGSEALVKRELNGTTAIIWRRPRY
jgi:general secretion pathway protein K